MKMIDLYIYISVTVHTDTFSAPYEQTIQPRIVMTMTMTSIIFHDLSFVPGLT